MNARYILILFLLFAGNLSAQVGIGTITPSSHAVLELKSPGNNQGFLVPRLTTAQRNAIDLSEADNGLMVYDSDDQKFYYWQTTQWQPLRSGSDVSLEAGAGINISGNTISAVADGDGDATNEIQDLQLTGNTLTISNSPSATAIDLAPYAGTNTDNQTLTFDTTSGLLAISGGNDVTVTPAGSAGGVLSGTYPDPGLALTSGNSLLAAVNNAATTAVVNASKIAPSTTEGQVLTTVSGSTAWADLPALAGGTITTTEIANGTIVNADISSTAGIAVDKLAAGVNGQVLTTLSGIPQWSNPQSSTPGLAEVLKTGNDAKAQDAFNFRSISIGGATVGSGALNVNGSHFVSFTEVIEDGYIVKPEDYILIAGVTGNSMTINLPPAAENRRRILIIRSTGTIATEAVTVSSAELIDGAPTSEPLHLNINGNVNDNVAYSITIISTGTTWLTINRAIAFPNKG